MQAIRVRAWVEVVGSVMEFISFQSSMKCQKFSGATLREKRKARCPRMNSLAKYLALQYNNNNNNCVLPGLICPTELWHPGTAQE